jgi:hypothetical protein
MATTRVGRRVLSSGEQVLLGSDERPDLDRLWSQLC